MSSSSCKGAHVLVFSYPAQGHMLPILDLTHQLALHGLTITVLIIKSWAPQVSLLNHRAVGGFLSHCGWNSVLEAIVSGVTILGWPVEADQFVNARLLVDYPSVTVRVCERPDTVPDSSELAHKIAESMSAEIAEKARAKELKDKLWELFEGFIWACKGVGSTSTTKKNA